MENTETAALLRQMERMQTLLEKQQDAFRALAAENRQQTEAMMLLTMISGCLVSMQPPSVRDKLRHMLQEQPPESGEGSFAGRVHALLVLAASQQNGVPSWLDHAETLLRNMRDLSG